MAFIIHECTSAFLQLGRQDLPDLIYPSGFDFSRWCLRQKGFTPLKI